MDGRDNDAEFNDLKGDFELGLNDNSYEKFMPLTPVPNAARFIHDFSAVCLKKITFIDI